MISSGKIAGAVGLKGELKVTLFRGTEEISITNNSVYNILIKEYY